MPHPILAEDEPLIEQYLSDFHAALPAATPQSADRARRAKIEAHAAAALALIRRIIGASPAAIA